MTMLSFRIDDADAARTQAWADALGVDRSQLLRDAVHAHLVRLESEADVDRWAAAPLDDGERSFAAIADWGAADEWADWDDAAG